jgi:Na+/melibiose symporter-like transporter
VFFDVGYQAILPDLVERDRLAEGNSRLEVSNSAAQLLGPGIGGWLVGLLSAPIAIVLDALSFIGSAALLVGIRGRATAHRSGADRPRTSIRREILDGVAFYRANRLLRALTAVNITYFVGVWFAGGTFIAYLARDLRMSPEAIGLGYSIGATGVLAGAAAGAAVGRRIGIGPTLAVSIGLGAISWSIMAFAEPATALVFLALSGIGHGVTSMAMGINYVSLRQAITPAELQGRVNATGRWLNWTMIPLAAIGGGVVATAIGIRPTILIGSAVAFLAVPILLASPLGRLRAMPPDVSLSEAPSRETASR